MATSKNNGGKENHIECTVAPAQFDFTTPYYNNIACARKGNVAGFVMMFPGTIKTELKITGYLLDYLLKF